MFQDKSFCRFPQLHYGPQLAGLEPNADKLRTGTGTNLIPEKETYIYIYILYIIQV